MNNNNDQIRETQELAEKLKKSLDDLAKQIEDLEKKEEELAESIKSSSDEFKNNSKSIESNIEAIKKLNNQIAETSKVVSDSSRSLSQNKDLMSGLLAKYNDLTKTHANNSRSVRDLKLQIVNLATTIDSQERALKKSGDAFDFHKNAIDALKTTLDDLKKSSGDFAPALEDVAKGFNFMKDGLEFVKTGFTDVGSAMRASGFGLLVLILQSIVEYLTKTPEGMKIFTGALNLISAAVEAVKKVILTVEQAIGRAFFHPLDTAKKVWSSFTSFLSDKFSIFTTIGNDIVDALSHPAETIKKIWNLVIENLTNRFKGLGVIIDGLLHLNFKKVTDGFIQVNTGITNATDKTAKAFGKLKQDVNQIFTDVKNGAKKVASTISDIYNRPAQKPQETETGDNGSSPTTHKTNKEALHEHVPHKKIKSKSNATENERGEDLAAATGISLADSPDFKQQTKNEQEQTRIAVQNAQIREIDLQKVKRDAQQKQAQLDKERMEAEAANQKKYLDGVTNISSKLMGIFGKNTIAAKAAFKAHQAAAAAQVIVDTRTAIMGIWKANSGFPLIGTAKAIAETAIVAATGASNLAQIMKQKPGFAAGGQYVSDGRGAILSGYSRSDNTNAYLRSGEAVVVSEAMRNPWARNLVSAVNVAFGGRDFSVTNPGRGYAIGGIFTDGGNTNRYYNQPMNDAKDLANTLAYQMINNFPPIYVDVKDINNQQNILAQTVNRVNL
ncbi:hypothetical protein [Mucilaginibacter sp. KACC 22063]|uniref:hypothetical protein n=1 Tax=Mucilaginibacter sp. KACC 22063 TaxID=3025666 RepID=UPI0023668B54|nr:hypothetical protein [Mucilaginibacter sp. KACC 22063]WDF54656.1 hypothetical protein PQ461_17120 [Mucilaginibacter sp. KACC 22063]